MSEGPSIMGGRLWPGRVQTSSNERQNECRARGLGKKGAAGGGRVARGWAGGRRGPAGAGGGGNPAPERLFSRRLAFLD